MRNQLGKVNEMQEMEPLMTIEEVAEYLRVPVLTVRWLRQEGRFAPAVKVGRRLAWRRSVVVSWIDAQQEVAA
jgi:excisionase family DNA binding protein